MKKVSLGTHGELKTKDVFLLILSRPTTKGLTIAEVRKATKIMDRIEAADGHVLLEEADYKHLKAHFDNFAFGAATKDLVNVADDLDGAEDYEPTGD